MLTVRFRRLTVLPYVEFCCLKQSSACILKKGEKTVFQLLIEERILLCAAMTALKIHWGTVGFEYIVICLACLLSSLWPLTHNHVRICKTLVPKGQQAEDCGKGKARSFLRPPFICAYGCLSSKLARRATMPGPFSALCPECLSEGWRVEEGSKGMLSMFSVSRSSSSVSGGLFSSL